MMVLMGMMKMQAINPIYKEYKKLFTNSVIKSHTKSFKHSFLYNFANINSDSRIKRSVLYDEIYKKLLNNYRFEYLYKNEIINYFYEDIIQNKKQLLFEFNLYQNNTLINIVDTLIISEEDVYAIEIKSDVDSIVRLHNQLETYCKLFKYVSVFVSEYRVHEIDEYLMTVGLNNVGIISLTNDFIKTVKKPIKNNINKTLLIENILQYKPFDSLNENDSVEDLYSIWIKIMKEHISYDSVFFSEVPKSIRLFAYTHPTLKKRFKLMLLNFFKGYM